MAIEDILKALEDQSQADCDECLAEARDHAKHIIEEAEREATHIRERYAQQVERSARSKAAQVVNAARLESKMRVSAVKGDGLEGAFTQAHDELGSLRNRGDYSTLFEALLSEALAGASGPVRVLVAPADVDLARQLVAQMSVNAEVEGDPAIAGGVLVELDGGSILRRNTFEDRLERARDLVQNDVAKVLLA